jgi:hypothetical protein
VSRVPVPTWAVGALFAAGAVLSALSALQGIQPNDEGLMLQAAARIADGQVPYADFWWFYPPGQPYLLAALWEVFGASLLPWRALRVLLDAGVALLAFALALRHAPLPAALVAWLAALLAMAYPTGPHPFPLTLAACLGALLVLDRRPALAGVLVGVAAAWRLEFAAGLAAAAVLGLALRAEAMPRGRAVARFAVGSAITAALLYLPVVVAAGPGRTFDLLVDYPLTDFADYQRLPFPLDYDGPLNTSSIGGFLSDSAEPLLLFYLPLVLVIGLACALAALAGRRRELDATMIATAAFSLVMLQYLLVRTDLFHTAPLAVIVAVLAAWALRARPRAARAAAAVAAACVAYAVVEGADRRVLAITEDGTTIAGPVADGVRAGPEHRAGLNETLRHVRARTRPGEPIYVATRRSDLVTAGHPLFYVLANRTNATRYDIAAPGVVTSAPVQREIVRDLDRRRVRFVVRWTDPITAAPEPNAAGRSSGVRILDRYLARRYRGAATYGPFVVLERR